MLFSGELCKAREEAGPVITTVDPADIRGLVTTLLISVRRLPRSRHEGRLKPPLNAVEGCAIPGPRRFPEPAEIVQCCYAAMGTSLAMAHMKAASSRAMAVTTTLGCLPRAIMRRKRLQSRSCAFQAMSWMGLGRRSSRFWM